MSKLIKLLVAGMVVFAMSGCSAEGDDEDGSGSSLTRDAVINGSNSAYDSTINLYNDIGSIEDICDVYSAPANSGSWQRLTGTPIVPGDEHEWGSDNCNQDWDLKVVDCIGNESIETYYRECDTTTYFTFRNW